MFKRLHQLFKPDRERFSIPRGVQNMIPIRQIWPDGIFLVGGTSPLDSKYTNSFRFTDINYSVASKEDKEAMFLAYSEVLNALDSGSKAKITIINRRLNKADFKRTLLLPFREDGLDNLRNEYNTMLIDKATGGSGIVQERYITISVVKRDISEARAYFSRIGADLSAHLSRSAPAALRWTPT